MYGAGNDRVRAVDAEPACPFNPRRELAGLTPGIPGSHRSSAPCRTSRRRPRRGARSSWSGSHGARPRTPVTAGCAAARTPTAPPSRSPSEAPAAPPSPRSPPRVLDTEVEPPPRLDAGSGAPRNAGRETAVRAGPTSHSIEALRSRHLGPTGRRSRRRRRAGPRAPREPDSGACRELLGGIARVHVSTLP